MEDFRNVIVVGASAGGIAAIKKTISKLSPGSNSAILVVLHMSAKSNSSFIANEFQKHTTLTCVITKGGERIQNGYLYIAPNDHHMMVEDSAIVITHGAHENKYRPSIDVLFRSVAVNYGNRVIGIILTGMLDDGTAGMSAIKRAGGTCIVQTPSDAEFPGMPQSVINTINVDYEVFLEDIPTVLSAVIQSPLPAELLIPQELKIEAALTTRMVSNIDNLKTIAKHSDFTCPECGGGLWAVNNDIANRYRCHTGHVYSEKALDCLQDENLENSIWVCIRMMEEKYNLLKLRISHEVVGAISSNEERLETLEIHIRRLKDLLSKLRDDL